MRQVTLGLTVSIAFLLNACVNNYANFYTPYATAEELVDWELEFLSLGQEPAIYGSDNYERDIRILRAKGYLPIGYSSFNGQYEDSANAVAQAKTVGATIVLTQAEFTNTQTTTTPLFLPNNQTTYHSGSAYGSGGYANYSGTSTTYGSQVVPITSTQRRYDQSAVYLAKSNRKRRFGVDLIDLTPELRAQYERNTGALVDIVIENHPAFYSNVMAGDVLIEIDGASVMNMQGALDLLYLVPGDASQSNWTVIRNGQEKVIPVTLPDL